MSTFISPLYGYTVDHPTAFVATPATEAWQPNALVDTEVPWVDRFFAFQTQGFVGIAAQDVPTGSTATAWMSDYAERLVDRLCGGPPSAWTDTTVDGVAARRLEFECDGTSAVEVVWVDGDRAWVITGESAVVDLMLATFEAGRSGPSGTAGTRASIGRPMTTERLLKNRTYAIQEGRRDLFGRRMAAVVPMLQRYGIDVVGHGPSIEDEQHYVLLRSFASSDELTAQEDAFYESDEWRSGPRAGILEYIDAYQTVVLRTTDVAIRALAASLIRPD